MTPPAPAGPGRWPMMVLPFAIAAVGVPGSLIALFKTEALQHPGLTLLCVLLWELLLLIAGLVTDVWSKLRSRWVDRLADWIDHSLQALFSRYRRRYLDYLFYRHRDFDVKGLTTQGIYNLELEQVFVDLTIQPPPGGNPADPIRPFPKELTGRRSIWDYLTSESFTDHLALIGAPGSGKTTLFKKIALQMTGRKRPKIRQSLPILLFLREHAEAILATPPPSLADVASADLIRKQCQNPPPAVWFRNKLEAGRCLVLLDGLDEVASQEARQKVVAWVETQIMAFPKNRILISSRPHGYSTCPVAGVSVLEIQPFNRDQVCQFVYNWYRANEIHASGKFDPGVEMVACEGAEDLLRRLGNSQTLTDLAVNPLLLTMIANVHRFRSSLPGRRAELYAEIFEVFLGKRQRARGIEDALTPLQKQRVLQPLAYQLMTAKRREIPIGEAVKIISESLRRVAGEQPGSPEAEFLKNIETSSGLLLERELGTYSFAHLAFQEYLTAVYIRENGLAKGLINNVIDPWWHEVIRLYSAHSDASGILAACLATINPTVTELSLAIDCLEEAREIDPLWRTKIDSFLSKDAESLSPDKFRLAAETLLSRRLRSMISVNDNTHVDTKYISHAEYQLFIDEGLTSGEYRQPDHWHGLRFPEGQSLNSIVGVRSSDSSAFCKWLSRRDNTFFFRLPHPGELEQHRLTEQDNEYGGARGFWTTDGFTNVGHARKALSLDYLDTIVTKDLFEKRGLDLALGLDIERGLELLRASTHSSLRDLIQDLNLGQDIILVSRMVSDHILNPVRDRILSYIKSFDRTRACRFAREHVRPLDLDLSLSLYRDHSILTREAYRDIHLMWRVVYLYYAAISDDTPLPRKQTWLRAREKNQGRWSKESFLSIYGSLVLLEAQADGVISPIEGIRIIKERRS